MLAPGNNGIGTLGTSLLWVEAWPRVPERGPLSAAARQGLEARTLLQRLLGIIVAVLIVVWIVSNPAAAGDTVHGWITGIVTFFQHLS